MAAEYQVNRWVNFLRKYGPIPRNDNMYDETIQRALKRSRSEPLEFEVPHLTTLLENFKSDTPTSVILTGTAGDGKTYLCRKIWEGLGGSEEVWQSDDKVRLLRLQAGRELAVIKDLSELRDEIQEQLGSMAQTICGQIEGRVYLIAANDGQLVDAWSRVHDSPSVEAARELIEDLLVTNTESRPEFALRLYNLSRTSAAETLERVLAAVLGHSGWQGCSGCRGQEDDASTRCPIWENYSRLHDPLFQDRLRNLLKLCDHNDYHLPIRQLLILCSNVLLGHSSARDSLLSCKSVPSVLRENDSHKASPYGNVFGENLRPSRQQTIEVFEVLRRFGVGEETSNRIDNLLIYGADDASLKSLFDDLVARDGLYGFTAPYSTLQTAYLEGDNPDLVDEYLNLLRTQRQRLFFTAPEEQVVPLRLWDLTVFQFAGEYLGEVCEPLLVGQRPPRHIPGRLVRGINRVFTGMLTATERQVVLATTGSYSQARVSRIEEALIEVEPTRGQRVTLESRNGAIVLVVYLDRDVEVPFPLPLVRYEFLSRVAEGALPTSFSRECYEDLLAFKSKLLSENRRVERELYGQTGSENELNLKLLSVDSRGFIQSRPLQVQL